MFFFFNDESENSFENIKHIDESGQEYWLARELYPLLEYTEFNKFVPTITRAMSACIASRFDVSDHFADVSEMVPIGSGAMRAFPSYKLSRYACYLIAQNGDSRKKVILAANLFRATQTDAKLRRENVQ